MGFYDNHILPRLIGCACSTKPIMKQREKVVPGAEGRVLELGCGTGTNFEYYDTSKLEKLYALEPSEAMLKRARDHEKASDLPIEFLCEGAEKTSLESKSIDTAVITFVLCTIPDWQSALKEVKRVLKPGGKVVFAEHGLSPDEGVAKWQHRLEPLWKAMAGGCHLTRPTDKMLEEGGFKLDECQTMYLPNSPKVAGYSYWGSASLA